jgi:Uncharacterized protein conserved in bacteria
MKYRIENREGIRLVGFKSFISLENGLDYRDIPALWKKLSSETFDELFNLSDSEPTNVVGIFGEKHDNGFDYWIAASTTKPCPPQYEEVTIPAAKWAIFEVTGAMPDSIQDFFKRLYTEWFPEAEYTRNWEVYEMEWFSHADSSSDAYICEGWVPVFAK